MPDKARFAETHRYWVSKHVSRKRFFPNDSVILIQHQKNRQEKSCSQWLLSKTCVEPSLLKCAYFFKVLTMSKKLPPGTPAPKSGQYKNDGTGNEVTGVKGKPLPPTPAPGQKYTLVDPTKHQKP